MPASTGPQQEAWTRSLLSGICSTQFLEALASMRFVRILYLHKISALYILINFQLMHVQSSVFGGLNSVIKISVTNLTGGFDFYLLTGWSDMLDMAWCI